MHVEYLICLKAFGYVGPHFQTFHLCSPGDLHFSKERLTPEEMYEEMCVNELLPKPFHSEFSKVPHKHPTRVLAAAVHFLIHKRMFDTKTSQAIAEKKLHMAVSGCKYDPGKQPSKRKGEPKDPKELTEQKKPKMAQQVTATESAQQATDIPDTQAVMEAKEHSLSDDDDDSLPDPFASVEHATKYSGPKEFTTKNPPPCKPCNK